MDMNGVIWNGLEGPSVDKLIQFGGDPGILRPFRIGNKCYVSLRGKDGKKHNHQVKFNSATLPHEVWLDIDKEVTRAAMKRLRAVADLRGAGLEKVIPNGFGVMGLMTQTGSRTGTAQVGMDPSQKGPTDRQIVTSRTLPLPCIWSDFSFGARELAVSRRGGFPLDTNTAEDAGRSCAEMAEQMLIGNSSYDQYKYMTNAVIYGYTDFTSRVTFTITAPDDTGWTGATLLTELLAARQSLIGKKKFGPYVIYLSPDWAQYLDKDYASATAGTTQTITIRQRILQIPAFSEIRELDYLTGWDILIVQMESSTVREVVGMEFTPVQWEENGGQSLNYKVIGIMVPDLRADYDGNTGIAHGTAA